MFKDFLKIVWILLLIWKVLIVVIEQCSKSSSEVTPGDGDGTQGNCETGEICCANSICSDVKCYPGGGNGVDRGNCPGQYDVCKVDGCCEGMYYSKKHFQYILR